MSRGASGRDPLPIEPVARPIEASLRVPGSKSLSNRHLVLAALADGPTRLRGLLACDDCDNLLAALAAFGVSHAPAAGAPHGELVVTPGALPASAAVNLGDGGTPTRFMIAFAAAQPGGVWTIDGSARMRERPVAEGVEMLRTLGARIEYAEADGRLPVRVFGGSLRGGRIAVGRTASSQFVSALMLVAPRLAQGIEIDFTDEPTSASYIQLSLAALAEWGAHAEVAYRPVLLGAGAPSGLARITIAPQRLAAGTVEIEPDASSAVYPAAAAVLTGGSVVLDGLPRRGAQPDSFFLDDIALRGAAVEALSIRARDTNASDATRVRAGRALRGLDSDYGRAPDAAVMAMVLAACGDAPSRFTGLETLRVKESDRIAAVAAGLRALGGTVETGDDWARIHPLPARLVPAAIDTVNDHRIAMAFAVLGLARAGVSIKNPGCVAKSWPGFWTAIDMLRSGT